MPFIANGEALSSVRAKLNDMALPTKPAASRAELAATEVAATTNILWMIRNDELFAYQRDIGGTALTTADGATWSPVGDPYPDHFADNTPGTTDMSTAFNSAVTYARAEERNVRLAGVAYVMENIVLNGIEGVDIIGVSGADPVVGNAGSWIYWKASSSAAWLFAIKSCRWMTFKDVNFFSNSNASKASLVVFQCNQTGSGFANTRVGFRDCSFIVSNGVDTTTATVHMKSSINCSFDGCSFSGSRAIKIGADTDLDPVTGGATLPNGEVVNLRMTDCVFYGDIVREKCESVTYENCNWVKNSFPFGGSNYYAAAWQTSGNEDIRSEVLINPTIDSADVTHNIQSWFVDAASPPTDVVHTVTVVGGLFQSAKRIFDIQSGKLSVHGGTFVAQNKPGGSGLNCAFYAQGSAREITHTGCGFDGLLALNTTSVVSQAFVDARSTSIEDDKFLLARGLATSVAFGATATWQTVLSRTLSRVDGGRLEVSYTVAISSAADTTFSARLRVNGVVIDESYERFTTNTASTKLFSFSLAPTIVMVDASDDLDTPVVDLQVQQATGTLATIQGANSTFQRTRALVRTI